MNKRWKLKKIWIAYHFVLVSILLSLIVLDIVANTGNSIENVVRIFSGLAIYVSAFNIFIAMPVWIVVLLFNRRRMDKKSVWIGLALFLTFVGLTAWPVVSIIGQMFFWGDRNVWKSKCGRKTAVSEAFLLKRTSRSGPWTLFIAVKISMSGFRGSMITFSGSMITQRILWSLTNFL